MSKLFVFDVETTGLQYWRHCIYKLSGMIVIDGEVKEYFNFKIQPRFTATIDKTALELAGLNVHDVLRYPPREITHRKLIEIMSKYVDKYNKNDKLHLVGYNNASFGNQFLRSFFIQCEDRYFGSWFWGDSIDVMVLASLHLMDKRFLMPNFELTTVAEQLGMVVDLEKLHNTEYNIALIYEMYNLLTKK